MNSLGSSVADPPSKLLTYLRLFRLPNVFTAMADVSMGYLFVHSSLAPWPVFACLALASCFLYTAGMVLNDVYDVQVDRQQRPHRPIPSGQIGLSTARRLGYGLLAGGVGLAALAGLFAPQAAVDFRWRAAAVALGLAVSIVCYDRVFKQTPIGPLFMGLCRMLNVLLGMSLPGIVMGESFGGFTVPQYLVSAGIGTYIVGVTVFARTEAVASNRRMLLSGIALMIVGLLFLAAFPQFGEFADGRRRLVLSPPVAWPALIGLVGFSIIRRCLLAAFDPAPAHVQVAVKQCIVSLIVLDASVCLAVREPICWAIGILALLIPMLTLGRWVYST